MSDDDRKKSAAPDRKRDNARPNGPSSTKRDSDAAPASQPSDVPTIAPPSLSLPKGGGAIRGMGEQFSANPATGAGALSIPVYTSPTRDGLQPTLSVSYNSGAGNGPYGLGCVLSLPSIARRTDKRLPRYEEDDVFTFTGADDLVPSSFHGIWNNGSRTQGNFVISCYQPRVDNLFARIERWTDTTSGDFYWRVLTKDNLIHVYGQSASARIVDPADSSRVFRWLLESTTDAKGNQVCYRYRNEDGVNVAPSIFEQRRNATNVYPDRILYGNHNSTLGETPPRPDHPEDWLFEVVFDYGERAAQILPTPPSYTPPATWTVRQDPFSNFKPGFDLRTYRLCRQVLMFHRIDDANTPVLVRSTDFQYQESADISFLIGATQTGYDPAQTPPYQQLPTLSLSYTQAIVDSVVRTVDNGSLRNLPYGLDDAHYKWIDLDSEGVSGVLTQKTGGWFYKRNEGNATLGGPELVLEQPSIASTPPQQLVDLQRDGRKALVQWAGPTPGAQERLFDGSWGPLVAFTSRPTQEVADPNARLVDLDGDGLADLLVTEDNVLRWYPSLGLDGFDRSQSRPKPWDENQGPAIVFADAEQAIYLADMSGDGLSDIVRIRNGDICYWPNLGYGQFGAKITMGGAPIFDNADLFDQRRILLADVDGSGTTDVIYLDPKGARYWLNCAGNRFDAGHRLNGFPGYDSVSTVDAIDLLGNGTSCLVWSSRLPGNAGGPMRYLELTSGIKPHLLQTLDNGRGLTTTLTWAASTEFYLADRRAGSPWATRIPFPVQVVKHVDAADSVTGDRLTTRFAYHHGFFDGIEREFRGFGMVEQWDAEAIDPNQAEGAATNATVDVLTIPPIHTKTWFHTGAFLEGVALDARFATEYYQAENEFTIALPDSTFENLASSVDARQATRALAGHPLRQEVYADDNAVDTNNNAIAGIPFTVTVHNYHAKALQAATETQYGIYVTRARETLTCHLERNPTDPRIAHEVVIAGDDFGSATDVVSLAYPRRAANLEGVAGQDQLLATYAHNDVLNVADQFDWYRVAVPYEKRAWEVHGFANAPTPAPALTIAAPAYSFNVVAQALSSTEIAFEAGFDPTAFQRRLISDTQVLYRQDDGQTEEPFGNSTSSKCLRREAPSIQPDSPKEDDILSATGKMNALVSLLQAQSGGVLTADTDLLLHHELLTTGMRAAGCNKPTDVAIVITWATHHDKVFYYEEDTGRVTLSLAPVGEILNVPRDRDLSRGHEPIQLQILRHLCRRATAVSGSKDLQALRAASGLSHDSARQMQVLLGLRTLGYIELALDGPIPGISLVPAQRLWLLGITDRPTPSDSGKPETSSPEEAAAEQRQAVTKLLLGEPGHELSGPDDELRHLLLSSLREAGITSADELNVLLETGQTNGWLKWTRTGGPDERMLTVTLLLDTLNQPLDAPAAATAPVVTTDGAAAALSDEDYRRLMRQLVATISQRGGPIQGRWAPIVNVLAAMPGLGGNPAVIELLLARIAEDDSSLVSVRRWEENHEKLVAIQLGSPQPATDIEPAPAPPTAVTAGTSAATLTPPPAGADTGKFKSILDPDELLARTRTATIIRDPGYKHSDARPTWNLTLKWLLVILAFVAEQRGHIERHDSKVLERRLEISSASASLLKLAARRGYVYYVPQPRAQRILAMTAEGQQLLLKALEGKDVSEEFARSATRVGATSPAPAEPRGEQVPTSTVTVAPAPPQPATGPDRPTGTFATYITEAELRQRTAALEPPAIPEGYRLPAPQSRPIRMKPHNLIRVLAWLVEEGGLAPNHSVSQLEARLGITAHSSNLLAQAAAAGAEFIWYVPDRSSRSVGITQKGRLTLLMALDGENIVAIVSGNAQPAEPGTTAVALVEDRAPAEAAAAAATTVTVGVTAADTSSSPAPPAEPAAATPRDATTLLAELSTLLAGQANERDLLVRQRAEADRAIGRLLRQGALNRSWLLGTLVLLLWLDGQLQQEQRRSADLRRAKSESDQLLEEALQENHRLRELLRGLRASIETELGAAGNGSSSTAAKV